LIKEQEQNNRMLLDIAEKLVKNVYALQKTTLKFKKKDELIIGINPALSPDVIKAMYLPAINAVGETAGFNFRVMIAADYNALADCLIEGIVDVGWFSPLAYVNARYKADITPIATPVVNGTASYRGYIITVPGSGISFIKDLKGKKLAFVDPKSASGYAYPRMLLKKAGIDPDRDLLEKVFLGTHSRVVEAVLQGTVDAGATYSEALDDAKKRGLAVEKLKILAETDPIPKDCIAARPDIEKSVVDSLKSGFMAYRAKKEKMNGGGSIINGFIPAMDENYDIVRAVANDAG
jgi:phosphonate transport system substrate-binding protein